MLLAMLLAASSVHAGEPVLPQPTSAEAADSAAHGEVDPCRADASAEAPRLDKFRQGVFTSVCTSSEWFDGLFGDARDYADYPRQTYGRVGLSVGWNKVDGVGLDGHFRANVYLPALGKRFNAVFGRETEESFVNDNFDDLGYLPGLFSDDRDANWYAGLNYGASEGANHRFDVSAGVQLTFPLNPYVKARYRYDFRPADDVVVATRTTPFWENNDGLGITFSVDTDWAIRDGRLTRWTNTFTRSEVTDGIKWKTRLAFYQALSELSALRYEGSIRGETQGIQPYLKELKITYRRSLWRDWFFVETYGGVFTSDDEDPDKRCQACLMVGIGFDMMFGERYDQNTEVDTDGPPADQANSVTRP